MAHLTKDDDKIFYDEHGMYKRVFIDMVKNIATEQQPNHIVKFIMIQTIGRSSRSEEVTYHIKYEVTLIGKKSNMTTYKDKTFSITLNQLKHDFRDIKLNQIL